MFQRYFLAPLAALLLLAAAPRLTHAQTGGVGIGTTAPDASAALDIVSSSKGLLLPRVANATSITNPAPGLLVYQTGGTAGFYYNAGTAATPSWQRLSPGDNLGNHTATTNIGLNGNYLSNASGNPNGLRLDNSGNATLSGRLGIGTSAAATPAEKLEIRDGNVQLTATSGTAQPASVGISNNSSSLNLALAANAGEYSTLAQPGDAVLRSNGKRLILAGRDGGSVLLSTSPSGGTEAERLRVLPGGNVGIGTSTPGQKLEVAGQVFSSTGGFRFPDNTVQTTASLSGVNAVLNQTTQQANANFNISGNGIVGGSVGIGTTTPDASAALDVSSTSKGFLPPRLSQTQRDAIGSPAVGLVIYNTYTNKLNTWNGTSWTEPLTTTEQPFQHTAQTFVYTGAPQTYTVPRGVTSLAVDVAGAQGGNYQYGPYFIEPHGGAGARVQATLAVTPGEVLTIYVGGVGTVQPYSSGGGGYNNGGGGVYYGGGGGGGGGGASDVRRSATAPSTALTERIVVAGGGGGNGTQGTGGAGGGLTGSAGSTINYGYSSGTGATQTAGGNVGGAFGQGGNAGINPGNPGTGGGGGGGYYGGGGAPYSGGGGGGSSWVLPTGSSNVTMTAGYQSGNGLVVVTPGPAYAAPALDASNFINVPGDNLGNHTATQNLNLAAYQLVGNGGTTGLVVGSTGNVGIGTAGAASQKLEVAGTVYSSTGGFRFPDNTVQATAATTATGADFIQNTTSPQAGSNFNISGAGKVGGLLTAGSATVSGNAVVAGTLGLGTTAVAPATQALDVRGNVRLGTDGGSSATGTGQAIEWVGPGVNTDPVGIYRVNPNSDQSELRVVVGDAADANDKFMVGRTSASAEGGIPAGTFTPSFTVRSDGNVGVGTTAPGQKLEVAGNVKISGTGNGLTFPDNTVQLTAASGGSFIQNATTQQASSNFNISGAGTVGGLLTAGSATVSGNVGIGTSPAGGLHIDRPEVSSGTALGITLGGGSSGNPSIELRGDGKTPYIDFVEAKNSDYSTRLISSGGTLNVNGTGSSSALLLKVNGSVQATNVVYTSDARFKTHVRPLTSALASVLALRGVRYEWNALGVQHGGTAGASQVGLLAQEVEKIYPELVSTDAEGYKAVNYAQLTPVLLEALKEQQAQIEALQAANARAQSELQAVKAQATADKAQATAQATATLDTFEARLRRLETGTAQAQR